MHVFIFCFFKENIFLQTEKVQALERFLLLDFFKIALLENQNRIMQSPDMFLFQWFIKNIKTKVVKTTDLNV